MELINFISVYDDILPKKPFEKLFKVCKHLNWQDALIGNGHLDKNTRKVKVCELLDISNSMTEVHWFNVMENIFKVNIEKYVGRNKIENMYSKELEVIQVLKYSKSDHYVWHYDDGTKFPRTISCVYFLNENFEGGELCFQNPDGTGQFAIPIKENRMVIWPSNFLYPHKVNPVKNGERYSIVSWSV